MVYIGSVFSQSMEISERSPTADQIEEWNKDEFSKKILNTDLISPTKGDESGTIRDFQWEKSLEEHKFFPKDAQFWLGKGEKKWFQFFAKLLQKKTKTKFKEPLKTFPRLDFPPNYTPVLFSVGQSHLDLGYRWRYLQSTKKAQITTEKACFHSEKIPEFSFTISQPAMLEWILEENPPLFERLQDAVKEGGIELAGGSYCEPDCHLISGESWCRQRLFGQLFYQKYFQRFAEVEWVPDSFGFTSTIPQFLAKSQGKYMFTEKMNWNDSTIFPFATFWWESPDGSQILFRSRSGYQRRKLLKNWQEFAPTALLLKPHISKDQATYNYESKSLENFIEHPDSAVFSTELLPYHMETYGLGDGGHGPRGLEVQIHLALHKKGHIQLSHAGEYFKTVDDDFGDRLPVWRDELYLEYHRGTMTTTPLIKRMNRFNEWLLPALEKFALLAAHSADAQYPQEALVECWKFILLQQFHDVLPGSHPPELLDDIWAIWRAQTEKYEKISQYLWAKISAVYPHSYSTEIEAMVKDTSQLHTIVLFNGNSFATSSQVEISANQFTMDINSENWVILSPDGEILEFTILPEENCGKIFFNLPERISFWVKNLLPHAIAQFYLLRKTNLVENSPESKANDSELILKEEDSTLSVISKNLWLKFDKTTGACFSLKIPKEAESKSSQSGDGWLESISQGPHRFKPTLPELNAGIRPQAYYEYSGVYAAWDMFPNSREYPYPTECTKVRWTQEDQRITVKCHFQVRSPPPEKIETGVRKSKRDENADQWGRRDPNVKPQFPPEEEFTDISTFIMTYSIFPNDPFVHLTIKSNFQGKDILVKLEVPTATQAARFDAEVAYGIENRSTHPTTTRDKARWEQLMHTWVNLQSQDQDWGFSILNKGTYALDIHDGAVGLTLIRGKKYPKPFFNPLRKSWITYERRKRQKAGQGHPPTYTNRGGHIWEFLLYPHQGTPEEAKVLQYAHYYNTPKFTHILPSPSSSKSDNLMRNSFVLPSATAPLEISVLKRPHPWGQTNFVFGKTVSPEQLVVLRVVNWSKNVVDGRVPLEQLPVKEVKECDLLESPTNGPVSIEQEDDRITALAATWQPFEVKSFVLLLQDK